MEKYLKSFLLMAFCAMIMLSCGRKLDKAYDVDTALIRMNSLRIEDGGINVRAKTYASDLAIPGKKTFNADGIKEDCVLLLSYGIEKPQAIAYKNPYLKTYQASITKMMTALVCLENVDDLSREFTVTENSVIRVPGSSSAYLRPGDRITIEDLLYAMLIPSGNDAAVAVAEATAGSLDKFIDMMNEEAIRIGATSSHFMNPSGLHNDNHYTTVYDIYLIFNEALKYDKFREIISASSYTAKFKDKNGNTVTRIWKGSNRFMTGEEDLDPEYEILGGKTGTTNAAGHCLALECAKTDTNKKAIAIVMKADSKAVLYDEMRSLIYKLN